MLLNSESRTLKSFNRTGIFRRDSKSSNPEPDAILIWAENVIMPLLLTALFMGPRRPDIGVFSTHLPQIVH